jgi:predicted Zn-dependent protease
MARVGPIQEALKECKAEIAVAPFSAEAYVDAARVYLQTGDDTQAAVFLEKALKLDRPPIVVYRLLGRLYLNQGQYQSAVKSFRKYLAVETKDSNAYYLMARACKYTGDTQGMNQAIAAYKKTSEVFKNASDAEQALDTTPHYDDGALGDGSKKQP